MNDYDEPLALFATLSFFVWLMIFAGIAGAIAALI